MKARAIQVIPEIGKFPGESLDELPAEQIKRYVKDGLAAYLVQDETPTRRRKAVKGEDEVNDEYR